jgi:hypothetical protein
MEYTKKVLRNFNINIEEDKKNKYHFVTDKYGCSALIININLNTYRIDVDMDRCEMVISKKRIKYKAKRHPIEKWDVIKKVDKDCIYCSVRWVVNDSEKL